MKRILFIIFNDLALGGIQKKIVSICNSEQFDEVEIHLFLQEKTEFSLESNIDNDKVKVHYQFKLPFLRRLEKYVFIVEFLINFFRFRPSSILLFSQKRLQNLSKLKNLFATFGCKFVFSQDTILSFYNNKEHTSEVLGEKEVTVFYGAANYILVQTLYAKRDLIRNFSVAKERIKVIPNWLLATDAAIDTHFKNNEKKIGIIFLGRFEKQKRVDLLVALSNALQKNSYEEAIFFVGDGSEKQKLKQIARTHKNRVVLGPTIYPEKLLSLSNFLVLTSDFEGHPLVVIEAMKYGAIPIILSYPGSDEYIESGVTGFVCNSIEEMVEKIVKLTKSKNSMEQMRLNMKLYQRQYFGEKNVKKLFNILFK